MANNNLSVAVVVTAVATVASAEYEARMGLLVFLLEWVRAVGDRVHWQEDLIPLDEREALIKAYAAAGLDLAKLEGQLFLVTAIKMCVNKEINAMIVEKVKAGN